METVDLGLEMELGKCPLVGVDFGAGVRDRELGLLPSPSRTKDSTVFSRLPLRPLRMVALRLSSGNPISLRTVSFDSNEAPISPMLAPKI